MNEREQFDEMLRQAGIPPTSQAAMMQAMVEIAQARVRITRKKSLLLGLAIIGVFSAIPPVIVWLWRWAIQ